MTVKIEDVVKKYMALRTKKEELERETKDRVAEVKSAMEKLEAYLLQRMAEDGVTSFKTPYGTAFSTEKEFAGVADWQEIIDYVKLNDAFHLLEKRVSKSAIRAWMDEGNPLPPGVNWTTERDVNIRKPSNNV
jgi:hypothetical protein